MPRNPGKHGFFSQLALVVWALATPNLSMFAAEPAPKSCAFHAVPSGRPFEVVHELAPVCQDEAKQERELAGLTEKLAGEIKKRTEALAAPASTPASGEGALGAARTLLGQSIAELKKDEGVLADALKRVAKTHDQANRSGGKLATAKGLINEELIKLQRDSAELRGNITEITTKAIPNLEKLRQQRASASPASLRALDRKIEQLRQTNRENEAQLARMAPEIQKLGQAVRAHDQAYGEHRAIALGLAETNKALEKQKTQVRGAVAKAEGLLAQLNGVRMGSAPDSGRAANPAARGLTLDQKKQLVQYERGNALLEGMKSRDGTPVNMGAESELSSPERARLAAQDAVLGRQGKLDQDLVEAGGYDGIAARTRAGVASLEQYRAAILSPDDDVARAVAVKSYNEFLDKECQNAAVCQEYARLGVTREIMDKNFTAITTPICDTMSCFGETDTGKKAFVGGSRNALGLDSAVAATADSAYRSEVEKGYLAGVATLNEGHAHAVAAQVKTEQGLAYASMLRADAARGDAFPVYFGDGAIYMPPTKEDADAAQRRAIAPTVEANPYAAGLLAAKGSAIDREFILQGVEGANEERRDRRTAELVMSVVPGSSVLAYQSAREETAKAEFDAVQAGHSAGVVDDLANRKFEQKVAGYAATADVAGVGLMGAGLATRAPAAVLEEGVQGARVAGTASRAAELTAVEAASARAVGEETAPRALASSTARSADAELARAAEGEAGRAAESTVPRAAGAEPLESVRAGEATDPAKIKGDAEASLRGRSLRDSPISDTQADAVRRAHDVGHEPLAPGDTPRLGADGVNPPGKGNYTWSQLREKDQILRDAGFTADERRALMEDGVVGHRVTTPGASLHEREAQVIDNKFSTGAEERLEGKTYIPKRAQSQERVEETAKLWDEVRPTKELRDGLKEAAKTGEIPEEVKEETAKLRVRLKLIRFHCQAVCTEETQAETLDSLTKAMGHLDDATKYRTKEEIMEEAESVRKMLRERNLDKIDKELDSLEAMSRSELTESFRGGIKDIRRSISADELSVEQFHDVRKELGRMQTIVLTNGLAEGGTEAERSAYQSFRTLYDRVGLAHDEMEKNQTKGMVSFSVAQRNDIERLLRYFERSMGR